MAQQQQQPDYHFIGIYTRYSSTSIDLPSHSNANSALSQVGLPV